MEILLITSLSGEDVHGTDNGKKTGCGINLQKAENITRYIKKGEMTDLKELTCEKCKAVLAKRIIKADKKEMQRLIKEEKLRAKKGIEDENIVPLGNTTAKITAPQTSAPAPAPAPAKPQAAPAPAPQTPVSEQPASAPMPKTIPGTGVAIDNDLAQFAINVPQQEEVTPEPEKKAPADILSQFAIEKPDEDPFAPQEEAAPAPQVSAPQDDFLAQFAIPTPGAPEPEPAPAPVQPEPVQETAPEQQFGYSGNTADQFDADGEMNDIFTHPEEPKDIFAKKEEAPQPDELEMNDIFKNPEADIYTPAPAQETAPVAAEEKVQDITEEVSDDDIMKMFSISSGNSDNMEIFAKSAPAETSIYDNDENVVDINEDEVTAAPEEIEEVVEAEAVEEAAETEEEIASDWDAVANQLFGFEAQPEPVEEVQPEPVVETEPEPVVEAEPEPVVEAEPEPVVEAEPEPVVEAEPEPVVEAEPEPVVEAEPEPVVEAEPEPVVEAEPEPVAEAQPEPVKPVETEKKQNMHVYTAPVFADEVASRQTAPVQPTPVQPAPMPEQPVFVTVPQFAGYDMNGQPVYNYVQSQLVGYDQNGQPMFMPMQNMGYPGGVQMPQQMNVPVQPAPMAQPVQPTAPVQPTPAPVQPEYTAPVQPTPAPVQPAPAAPVQPELTPVQPTPAPVQPAPAPVVPPVKPMRPVQPVYGQGVGSGINISKIATEKRKAMPKSVANAVAVSKEKSTKNIFEMEGHQMPVLESIEDILSTMGDDSIKKKQQIDKAVPVFEEYKAPTRTASRAVSAPKKSAEPERPLTKAELKAKKKQEKIDQKFKKDLAKRGF